MQSWSAALGFSACGFCAVAKKSASCGQNLRKSVILRRSSAPSCVTIMWRNASTWGFSRPRFLRWRPRAAKACKNTDFRNFCPRDGKNLASRPKFLSRKGASEAPLPASPSREPPRLFKGCESRLFPGCAVNVTKGLSTYKCSAHPGNSRIIDRVANLAGIQQLLHDHEKEH